MPQEDEAAGGRSLAEVQQKMGTQRSGGAQRSSHRSYQHTTSMNVREGMPGALVKVKQWSCVCMRGGPNSPQIPPPGPSPLPAAPLPGPQPQRARSMT
jgi:hypothetical protein